MENKREVDQKTNNTNTGEKTNTNTNANANVKPNANVNHNQKNDRNKKFDYSFNKNRNQQNSPKREGGETSNQMQQKGTSKNVSYKHNYSHSTQPSRFNMDKIKTVETAEDIQRDIDRIMKEIELEIDGIKNIKLGI